MVLVDCVFWWVAPREEVFGDYVLAGVVAFGGACPEEELSVDSCRSQSVTSAGAREAYGGRLRIGVTVRSQLASEQICEP